MADNKHGESEAKPVEGFTPSGEKQSVRDAYDEQIGTRK